MPGRPPEAQLIYERRDEMGLSIREAARQASASGKNLSEGSWRRTESPRKLTRTPETLARMAQVVGVTPAELEARGRPDAAAMLAALPPLPAPEADLLAEISDRLSHMENIMGQVAVAINQIKDDRREDGGSADDRKRSAG